MFQLPGNTSGRGDYPDLWADRGSTDGRGSPVDEDLICRTVVLDLVHADPGDVVLRGPPDGGGAGRQI